MSFARLPSEIGTRPACTVATTVWVFDGGVIGFLNPTITSEPCCLRSAGGSMNQFSPCGGRMEKPSNTRRWVGLVTGMSCGSPAQPTIPVPTPSKMIQTRTIRMALLLMMTTKQFLNGLTYSVLSLKRGSNKVRERSRQERREGVCPEPSRRNALD